jgi:hypothetical protein
VATKQPQEKTTAQLVDELGRIEQQLEPYRVAMLQEDRLRAQIRERFDKSEPADLFEVVGTEYSALVGARSIVSVVSNTKAMRALGQRKFTEIAKLTLAALERTKVDLAGIVTREQTGARSLRIFRRATA